MQCQSSGGVGSEVGDPRLSVPGGSPQPQACPPRNGTQRVSQGTLTHTLTSAQRVSQLQEGTPPPITQPPGSRRDRAWAWFCWVPAACRVLCSYRQPHLILLVTSAWRSALDEQGQEAQTSVLVSQQVQAPGTASGSAQPATLSPASPQMGQRPPHSPFLSKWPLTRVPCTVTSLGTTLPRESMK